MAGGANWAGDGRGLQMAGGINLAKTLHRPADGAGQLRGHDDGFQLGVVNATRAHRERASASASSTRPATAAASRSASSTSPSTTTANRSRSSTSIGNGIHDVSLFATDVHGHEHRLQAGRPPPLHEPDRRLPARRRAGAAGAERFTAGTQALRAPAPASAGASPSSAARSRTPSSRPTGWRFARSGTGPTTRPAWRRCACRRAASRARTWCCWPARASTSRSRRAAAIVDLGRGVPADRSSTAATRRCGSTPACCSACKSDLETSRSSPLRPLSALRS